MNKTKLLICQAIGLIFFRTKGLIFSFHHPYIFLRYNLRQIPLGERICYMKYRLSVLAICAIAGMSFHTKALAENTSLASEDNYAVAADNSSAEDNSSLATDNSSFFDESELFSEDVLSSGKESPCRKDIHEYCSGREGYEVAKCLFKNKDSLSKSCKERIKSRMRGIKKACHSDIKQVCKEGTHGWKIIRCLEKHKKDLSKECRKELKPKHNKS